MLIQDNTPMVSIIILNYNGANYLKQCLFSVLESKYRNFEVIFVDNASTDSSLSVIEKNFANDKRLRTIRSGENLGFGAGNNFGLKYTKGHYIVLLNNDTIVDQYWLGALVTTMEKDKTIGLAGSTILSINGKTLRGAGGLWSDYLLFLYPIGAKKAADFKFIPVFEVSFATGCSLIARKEFLNEIGLFDPEIPFNYDDTLLSVKTWLAGKRVVSVSGSKVCHIGGATTKKFWNSQSVAFSLLRAKMCLLFDVYFDFDELVKALIILYFSLAVESTFSVIAKNPSEMLGSLRASTWLVKNFKHVWMNRLSHWSKPKISPEQLIAKIIRIKLPFPLCIAHSKLTYTLYRNECLKYEKTLFSN
jgi:GT2 family glycosyltransferase